MARSLFDWWSDNVKEFLELERHFRFKKIENNINVDKLKGQNFVITGKLHHFANRDALKESESPLYDDIEKYTHGARCTFHNYKCSKPCGFKEGITLTRKI